MLIVPPGRRSADIIRWVIVCWRDTREATRAVLAALPIMRKAARTIIVIVGSEPAEQVVESSPSADIAKDLGRHGAHVEVDAIDSRSRDVSEVLLEQAARASADLIVMGGYGHSLARKWITGA